MSSRQIPPSTTSTPLITSNDYNNNTNRETPKATPDKQLVEHDRMRMKEFGQIFNRHSSINRALLEELFRKEPSEYTQTVYRYASRIYHCLKEEHINPILKALASTKEEQIPIKKSTLDVPKIDYASDQQKRRTLKLAFSVLRYQKIVEELLEETQFFSNYPDLKDELSLVSVILYDYLSRKFQPRDDPIDPDDKEDLSNNDQLVSTIENAILQERTRLAAALARNRIKSQALSLEDLLPENVREVQQHTAELPVYAWVNLIKTDMETVIKIFENNEQMKRVKTITEMDKRTFYVDYHCSNLLVFHYSQKQRIVNHYLVRDNHLYLQDKSSCIAAHTVRKLLTKKDNICLAYVSGGLLLQLLVVLTEELESKIYAFGGRTDENIRDIQAKIKTLGAVEKRIKIFKERFTDVNFDEINMENCKVILCNPPDSRSALIQPLDFLYNEGEDVSLLKQFSQPTENKAYIKECIQRETAYMRQAIRYPLAKAIVYVTFSKNKSENEEIVHSTINEQNEQRSQQTPKKDMGVFKVSPPVLPIQFGIRNEQVPVLRQGTFIQFESTQKMNGVFVALLLRERERRRSTVPKKKTDDHDSDSDNQQKTKKDHGFQFETEIRAAHRRQQQQQQTVKSQRKNATPSSNRRAKSSAAITRDLASTSSTRFESTSMQQTQSVNTESKELTLSERLASIGRITNTLDTTQDETSKNNDLKNHTYQQTIIPIQSQWSKDIHSDIDQLVSENTRTDYKVESYLLKDNKEYNQSLNFHLNNINYQAEKILLTPLSNRPICHLIPIYSSNDQIIYRYSYRKSLMKSYRNIHMYNNSIPIKQCKITLENSKEIIQRCRTCKLSYRSKCIHYFDYYDINYLIRKIQIMNPIISKNKSSTSNTKNFYKR
ncbi:unnamed protein product [Rotaria sordida]|uniref:SAM-dependent MTase RsmB/NOP-type domain-containing protein n=1 Tax=Rotaria sordida TaxID=392033 RepID=A0A815HW96_9BILA|nr:unnamed protein product [Rotaria sordida]CAF1357169.1 unnamed protein product [Rotaria sordida]CAF3693659.1 unnamed protein product [Rotaria sordida]CAF3954156.1 unnamed protein product [Rotaria sordida]